MNLEAIEPGSSGRRLCVIDDRLVRLAKTTWPDDVLDVAGQQLAVPPLLVELCQDGTSREVSRAEFDGLRQALAQALPQACVGPAQLLRSDVAMVGTLVAQEADDLPAAVQPLVMFAAACQALVAAVAVPGTRVRAVNPTLGGGDGD
jgi:hypothetical protein